MLLKDYFYSDYPKRSKVFETNEMEELRNSIKNFFDEFTCAVEKDSKTTGHNYQLMYLLTHRNELRGLAHYLLDFQGTHDTFFTQSNFDLRSLSYMVFAYDLCFDKAHYRLLDLSDVPSFAIFIPEEDNVADWILSHINKYEEKDLICLFHKLEKIKSDAEASGIDFSDLPSQYILYNHIKKHVSFFKLYF